MSYKVCGYLLSDEALLIDGLRRGFGTDETQNARYNTIFRATMDLMVRGEVNGTARICGVLHKGQTQRCLALASTDPFEPFRLPSRRRIEALKKELKTDREPRWYTTAD
ncbi:hypothetical protein DXG03_009250 [Asterophora parasitica]|uniref:Uncharacterized protein n=1 Tax=Asterophora parasitica TaxID=117018 RepID=A0A9P7K8Q3_9AGAR|nr:hypothetical protein DXG03_009250 [Asterophora parasitica]